MSYTVSPEDTLWDAHTELPSSYSLRLLAVVAGAVLFVLGIVIGGLMGRSDVPQNLGNSTAELAALHAEINLLNIQAAQAKTRSLDLEQRLVNQQALFAQSEQPARVAEEREVFLDRVIEMTNANRQVCLDELQQFQRQSAGVPTAQVIQFAERLFESQSKILNSLASGEPLPSTSLDLQTSLVMAPDTSFAQGARSSVAAVSTPVASRTTVTPTPHARSGSVAHSRESEPTPADKSQRRGVFFTAPQRRRQGVTFFTPRPPSRVASRPRSGLTFTDQFDTEAGPMFR